MKFRRILTAAVSPLLLSIFCNNPLEAQLTKINVGYSAISD